MTENRTDPLYAVAFCAVCEKPLSSKDVDAGCCGHIPAEWTAPEGEPQEGTILDPGGQPVIEP